MENNKYHLSIKAAFASEYAFALKAQNFHWNTEGASFYQLHLLFERIYDEVYGVIDQFAEELRALQIYAPASYSKFSMLSAIEDENSVPDERGMVEELLADSEKMAGIFKLMFDMAESAGDHGLSNFFADRQDQHKKHSWMLRSTLK
jgi:starvation-inducible DNA-binding protein